MKMHWYALGSNCSLRKGPPIGVFLLLEPVHFQPTAMQTRCHFGSSVITPLLRPNVLLGLCTPWTTMSSWVPTWVPELVLHRLRCPAPNIQVSNLDGKGCVHALALLEFTWT